MHGTEFVTSPIALNRLLADGHRQAGIATRAASTTHTMADSKWEQDRRDMSDRDDAISDIAYADGFRAGWNAAMDYNAKTWTDAFPHMKRDLEQKHRDVLAILASMDARRSIAKAWLAEHKASMAPDAMNASIKA